MPPAHTQVTPALFNSDVITSDGVYNGSKICIEHEAITMATAAVPLRWRSRLAVTERGAEAERGGGAAVTSPGLR